MFKTVSLMRSLREHSSAERFCLITDSEEQRHHDDFQCIVRGELAHAETDRIFGKYSGDELRWACKPLVMLHLLQSGYDEVVYVDNDVFFFSDPDFIFDELKDKSVLLTPHFYLADPKRYQFWLEANLRIGLYNAGFVGASKNGMEAMDWWAQCCAYNVKKSSWRGLFDDQKYLDLIPVLFQNVGILKHPGCNLAFWNAERLQFEVEDGTVCINGEFPLVFIHFTKGTVRYFQRKNSPELLASFRDYMDTLRAADLSFEERKVVGYSWSEVHSFVRHMVWLLVRRFERFWDKER